MKVAVLATTLLAVAVKAANAAARSADDATGFRLWANMIYDNHPDGPQVQGQELGLVSTAECAADVIMVPAGEGAIFRAVNNDTIGVDNLGGDSSPFAGMVVPWRGPAMVPSGRPVEVRCGEGTTLFLNELGVRYPGEMGPDWNGAFMACPREYGSEEIILSYFGWGQRPLWGCSVIQLQPIY
ncbi:hypothetical protein CkaCkLH20_06374 [Colletotrichum karsti]|uniref:DUF7907 domain-containing protein n=1 Tax=Colletotrichum karsti TaxID=1095194 RepID=A0A9P6I3V8_9PEZI|nr:uncharacterized protein CkaCkLH20_06374 [Colletotrichum karsti]KAF9875928.1 hypothetical protein CkaCkLH20_06374 [Colletotrichum karsti]